MRADEDRNYLFIFESRANARIFVQRIALNLTHVAMLVDDKSVRLVDGADPQQRIEILRLARMSGASPSYPFRPMEPTRP